LKLNKKKNKTINNRLERRKVMKKREKRERREREEDSILGIVERKRSGPAFRVFHSLSFEVLFEFL
jgi:hypothetical protein